MPTPILGPHLHASRRPGPRRGRRARPGPPGFTYQVQLLGGEAGRRLAQHQQTEAIAAALPYGRLEVFDRSGHYPFVEVQERFAAVVGAFLLGRPLSI